MLLDFDVQSCSRSCSETGKALASGEVYFSVLVLQETETIRRDFSAEAWSEPTEENLGWWRSRIPMQAAKPKLAPTEVMLNLFAGLAEQTEEQQFRYVLGLLLIRRRVLKREEATRNEEGQEVITLFASKRDQRFEMIVDEPNSEQSQEIQQRMIELLYADGE